MRVHRATAAEIDDAYRIVSEYYEAVGVLVRDDRTAFEQEYFVDGAGLWLATVQHEIVGCIGLHRLKQLPNGAEIKRLYVRIEHRGLGVAESLLDALEGYAVEQGYTALYLDSKKDLMPAIRFYRRHGYQPCERYNDNPQATIFMRKELH
ncbi:GNAT family N-acetyltransferase [Alloacidobacterium dinghuense]|uniref:GNAT family N-acetyltransferase n=1 Tax=Alloacidobacterium dinghuense TaxID=2763107 RepID=A0A7G8BD00_9BACT|nr:GNAT family N-acetyltransferase [Alloacidobacterium dinghuense]QNI30420.1 GNAT family N-acetyltransferase [Alloacidobacterium dinghuense]